MTAVDGAVRWSRALTGGVIAAAVVALAAGDGVSTAVTLAVAAAGLVAGLPHGAVDHLLLTRLSGTRTLLAALAYGGVAVLAWIVLATGGPVALGAVLVLSVAHFGLGELEVFRASTGWRPAPGVAVAVAVAGTGALLLPLARGGAALADVAAGVSPQLADVIGSTPVRTGLVVVWLVAAIVAVTAALRSGHRGVAGDLVLVGVLGAVAPPLVAFAVWFGGWHAIRHTGRLLDTEPGCAALVAAGRGGAAVRRFARLAALPSAMALVVLALLGGLTVTAPDPTRAVADGLRVLLALTVPHMIVIAWLDRRSRDAPADPSRGRRSTAAHGASRWTPASTPSWSPSPGSGAPRTGR